MPSKDASDYILRISAGPSYDPSTHKTVLVNTDEPVHISNEHCEADVWVRVKDYRGLPKNSPTDSPYFHTPQHKTDRSSITFNFTPKHSINGSDLLFGNDFDHPIRDKLPYGFNQIFWAIKQAVDPGLQKDSDADKPWFYGALLSSMNALRIGGTEEEEEEKEEPDPKSKDQDPQIHPLYLEGATASGTTIRSTHTLPTERRARRAHFLSDDFKSSFSFDAGRNYCCDFFNDAIDFNDFTVNLPVSVPILGSKIHLMEYYNGQPVRYVLREGRRGEGEGDGKVLFVVVIELVEKGEEGDGEGEEVEEEEEEGEEKQESETKDEGGRGGGYVDEGVD
ncbi:DUF1769-domain-containing protein [Aulographum hederae CBS 113979]|uniref:DUF1769-domain-containing protein n=1 Tax=Aulographum hederae CBS 113979 TaxID=1176131 RepID=A0A6G1HBB8_9PEZI|nr:DUF1769-domain-containing protein [Aulographum hederae CBS 113979]